VGPRDAREEVDRNPKQAVLGFLEGWLTEWAQSSTNG
jgi:hypothetical protein